MNEDLKIKELISRYVDGEVTPEEKQTVEKCLKESPDYYAYYEELKKLNTVLDKNAFMGASPDWENQIQSSMAGRAAAGPHPIRTKSLLKKTAAGCVLLTFLTLMVSSTYVLNLQKFVSLQDTLVYAQSEFESGSKASLRVITLNSKDSKPIEDADIVVVIRDRKTQEERVLYQGKASAFGSPDVQFDMPDYAEGDYDLIIKADSKYGHDKIIKPIKIRKTSKVLLTTDKTLYQPGQTIHIRALALKSSDSTPVKNQELTLEVEDPKGNKVFRKKEKTSEFGIYGTTFTLANEINMGEYTVRVSLGDYSAEKKIEVKKYVLPKFKVGFETDKTYYLPGQELKGKINANYFFGKPTNNAKVKVEIRTYEVNMQVLQVVSGMTNEEGFFEFEYHLPSHFVGLPLEKGAARLFFDVSVTDQARHTEEITNSVSVAKDPIAIELIPESGDLVSGLENIIYVSTSYPDGKPAPATVHVNGQRIMTNQFGIGEIKVRDIQANSYGGATYAITASAEDIQGNKGSVSENLPISQGSIIAVSGGLLLRTDRAVLETGDTVYLQVFSAQSRGTVYLDVIKNKQTILTKVLEVENRVAGLELDLDETMSGTLELHAYKVLRNSDIVRDTKTIFVNHKNDLQLDISADKNTYLPGETAKINFATSKDSKGIPSAVGVSIVDESVFALQDKEPGLERLYFALEKELMTPKGTIYGLTLPEFVSERPPEMDEKTRAQAGNILMAAVQAHEEFPLRFSSREENFRHIETKKANYLNALFKVIFYILMLMPLSALALTIYNERRRKLALLNDFGAALLVLIGTLLFFFLFLFLLIAASPTISKYIYVRSDVFAIGIIGGIILTYIVSFIMLTLRARRENPTLLWVNILGLSYVLVFLFMFGISIVGQFHDVDILPGVWKILLAGLIFALLYARHSLEFIKKRSRLAYLSLIMVLIFSNVTLLAPVQVYSQRGLQGRLRSATDDIGDQFALGNTSQYEPYYLSSNYAVDRDGGAPVQKGESPRIRQFFPETLYSNPQVITDQNGQATIDVRMADSITSWRLTGLANSLNGNIGSGNLAMIVFQDFFVDIDLPVSLTQEDEVSIPVSIFNYLKSTQNITLELKQEDWFDLLEEPTKSVSINANGIDVVHFRIKARKLGNHKLTVIARGDKKSDAITRDIEIVPDGKEIRVSYSDMLDQDVRKTITVPLEAIDGSEKLLIKVYPGIFSQVVEGLDAMLKMPYGCFEQTSSTTYPNLLALDYMKSTKKITPEIRMKAEHFIAAGYQRLLTFEAEQGGFSIFGKNPAERIVTAYGLMEFSDMSKVYEIDSAIVPRMQKWLLSKIENDHWTPDGHYGAAYKARNSNVGATSYVTWALLDSGLSPNDPKIQRALNFIEKEYITEKDNPYTLALAVLSLSKGKRNVEPLLKRLDELAQKDKDTIYWSTNAASEGHDRAYLSQNKSANWADVETSALVALAYIQNNYKFNDLSKIMKYLITSKDSNGNWGSTQATVLAMKALLESVAKSGEGVDANITVLVDGETVQEIVMDDSNNDVLQLVDLKTYAKKGNTDLQIQFKGKGGLLYQIVSSHFLKWKDYTVPDSGNTGTGIHIDLKYDKVELKTNDVVTARVDANYTGAGIINYAMIDLGIPPGFQVLTEDIDAAVEKQFIEKYELTGRQLIIYLKHLDHKGIQLKYRLKAKFPIKGKTPKSSVYDYYNPEVRQEVEPVEIVVE